MVSSAPKHSDLLSRTVQVGNTELFGQADWEHEMSYAKTAGIDAFALNMANNDSTNDRALPMAFAAASSVGFKLFFSFDYAGNGPWPKDIVTSLIQRYATHSTYFHRGSQPFVSTFEGPGNMTDWPDIKRDTGCFFMPDWSSVGARPAAAAGIAGMRSHLPTSDILVQCTDIIFE